MNSEGQKWVKNVFLWAVNTIMLYLGPNEVTGLKKSKQFLLVVRSLCIASFFILPNENVHIIHRIQISVYLL